METRSGSSLTYYLSASVVGLVVYYLYKQVWTKDNWKLYGVKQVSLTRIMIHDFKQSINKLINEEGDTVGFHMSEMLLLTRDLNILKQVMVKDFNNFVDRAAIIASNSPVEKGVFFLGGQDWKRVRHVITPSFSTGKLKRVTDLINESGVKLANLLDSYAQKDNLLNIKHIMGQFTGEVIARTAFSLKTDCLGKTEDDEFTKFTKKIFVIPGRIRNFLMLIILQWRLLHLFLVKKCKVFFFDSVSKEADEYFQAILHRTVEDRKQLSRDWQRPYTDLFQNLISAKDAGDKEMKESDGTPNNDSWDTLPKTMSEEELLGQSMFIIFAGFDTTATTLQMCCYNLARHPDIDEKVYQEIQNIVKSDLPSYEEIQQLKYMEQVINETLRLYPPAPIMTRRAAETRKYGNITIPKGAGVIIPLDMVMRDPKHYPDPEKFDPDRFTEENVAQRDPMTFMPFGYGPRQCIGMRLAYIELKYCLVHVLRKVKFELNERTEPTPDGEIEILFNGFIFTKNPMRLSVKSRR
ncbi:cytochrome P450 3A24-like [Biomphalaria glabrata]|uniref:Cytochrome P450 3A24-like n=1 Tax=Biomphalaria glabrata TaxID=6526 RepID=A0A9W3AT92_BIOGL|nr:cytochrome P450 3A24-like [Biomphalaria glabrata]